MLGVVACGALYREVESLLEELDRDADVRYVPQELHEFPVNVPVERDIAAAVQSRIDALDRPEIDRIVVTFARSGGGVAGVSAESTPLVVSTADDCIATFVHGVEPWTMGEPKEFGTYYLSPGLIDRGVDSYKLYSGFVGEDDDLLARFEAAASDHPEMCVDWHEGDVFARALETRELDAEQAGRFFHQILRYYERVKLIDTGQLRPFHREYAESFRAFVADLSEAHGDGHEVTLTTIDGDLSLLRTLLTTRPGESPESAFVETYAAGEAVR
jgi:hypothetical protein